MNERALKQERTINDLVEDAYIDLFKKKPEFKQLTHAIWDEEAVEGRLVDDDVSAAMLIREWGVDQRIEPLANAKTATIRRALGTVLRRYTKSREQRRNQVNRIAIPAQ